MRFVCIVVKNRLTKSALILTVHLTDPQDYLVAVYHWVIVPKLV